MGFARWARLAREPRWGVLAASFVTLVLVQGATFTFPVFLIPLTREFGGLRGVAAAAFSLHNLVVGLTATVVDPLMRTIRRAPDLRGRRAGSRRRARAERDGDLVPRAHLVVQRAGRPRRGAPGQRRADRDAESLVPDRARHRRGTGAVRHGDRHVHLRPAQRAPHRALGWRGAFLSLGAGSRAPSLADQRAGGRGPGRGPGRCGAARPGRRPSRGSRRSSGPLGSGASPRPSSSRRSRTSWSPPTRWRTWWRPGSSRAGRRRPSG